MKYLQIDTTVFLLYTGNTDPDTAYLNIIGKGFIAIEQWDPFFPVCYKNPKDNSACTKDSVATEQFNRALDQNIILLYENNRTERIGRRDLIQKFKHTDIAPAQAKAATDPQLKSSDVEMSPGLALHTLLVEAVTLMHLAGQDKRKIQTIVESVTQTLPQGDPVGQLNTSIDNVRASAEVLHQKRYL